jgi:hypothetical protein
VDTITQLLQNRLLRTTLLSDGTVATPPTQLVAISTVGTTRTNKMPYSMQNLLGGGILEQRLQMQQAIINAVRNRNVNSQQQQQQQQQQQPNE